MNEFFLTCPRGLEEVTAQDINQHIKDVAEIKKGGVTFLGDLVDLYKVNLYSRTGMYLLKKLLSFKATNFDFLYTKVLHYQWESILDSSKTFSIRTKVKSKFFENSGYTTLKIKDAIVDNIRKNFGSRPSINKESPDLSLYVIMLENKITIYINTSGIPLFKRGYRMKIHRAGLNESLAAGLVLSSNWNPNIPFYDIMCGSGTIPIEAAMIAHKIPPRINRKYYAFKKLKNYDSTLLDNLIEKSKNKIIDNKNFSIFGSDHIKANISLAYESSKLIGLKKMLLREVKC